MGYNVRKYFYSALIIFVLFAHLAYSLDSSSNLLPPANLTYEETAISNYLIFSWDDAGSPFYWVYVSKENSVETAQLATIVDSTVTDFRMSFSGTYYFWVKSASAATEDAETSDFSDVLELNFIHKDLLPPANITIVPSETQKNAVTIKWEENSSAAYLIYMNKEDNAEDAVFEDAVWFLAEQKQKDIQLYQSGKYYFWIKAADGTERGMESSDFGEAVSYDFTYQSPAVPKGLTVTDFKKMRNTVLINWEDDDSNGYWIYYNTEDNPETATLCTMYATSGYFGWFIHLNKSGKYYFWIKGADGFSEYSGTSDFSESVSFDFKLDKLL